MYEIKALDESLAIIKVFARLYYHITNPAIGTPIIRLWRTVCSYAFHILFVGKNQ